MERWKSIMDIVINAALAAFGKKYGQNPDGLNANLHKLEPVYATKRSALLAYKKSPFEKTLSALRTTRCNAQRIADAAPMITVCSCATASSATPTEEMRVACTSASKMQLARGQKDRPTQVLHLEDDH
ncbi:hypothetical protein DPMN_036367 [Dreissena polymorpha]|uniref:Uncharacterized protein n=1 Tax=Dreissena polymorpha TaxID=45954 RepID=A0A9D4M9A9_DREPO|nr:hypothetical protein DPMN_036367 [Dreissena polymorpha]